MFLLFLSVSANAQSDTSGIKFIEPPDSTAVGTPDGKLISKEIGTAGRTIVSDDGKIELVFPAGALTKTTTISIHPTINLAPNGSGKDYCFKAFRNSIQKTGTINF